MAKRKPARPERSSKKSKPVRRSQRSRAAPGGGHRGSSDTFRALVEALPDMVFILDAEGHYLDAISSRPDLLLAPPEQLRGRSVFELLGPEVAEVGAKALAQLLDNGAPQALEYRLTVPAGVRWFEGRLIRLAVRRDDPSTIACVVRDITERKRSEETLRRTQALLRAVVDSLPFDFWMIGPDGRYQLQNAVCREHWGEVVGKYPAEVAPSAEVRALWQDNNRRAFAGEVVRGEVDYVRDGVQRHFLNLLSPVSDGTETLGVIGLNVDITDPLALTEQIQRAHRLESLGVMAGGIAHDFNNLLMAVVGHISLSRLHNKAGVPADSMLEEAERACLRAQALTQQLLTFAKGGQPVREVVAIGDLLRESARFAASGSSCRCELLVSEDLWPAHVDLGQVHQVIHNLVLNAVQAMPQGGVITVTAGNFVWPGGVVLPLPAGRYLRITVADTGIGIPPERLPRIFDPYFTTSPRGHGLGLAVAYSIVARHEGTIHVDSVPGQGTRVDVYLPAAEGTTPRPVAAAADVPRGHGPILVLDDEAALRSVTAVMLESLGYAPESAASCYEAVALCTRAREEGRPFCAAVLDLTVPGGPGGQECLRRLREVEPGLRAVIASGYTNDPVITDFRSHGFDQMLQKPFSRERLAQVLDEILRDRRGPGA
jgi:PAS domain S-box-containing protein